MKAYRSIVVGLALGMAVAAATGQTKLFSELVGPVPVDTAFLTFDLWVMLGASALLIPFVFFKWNITRRFGLGLTALYLFYVTLVLM